VKKSGNEYGQPHHVIKEMSSWSKFNKENMIGRKKVDYFSRWFNDPIDFHEDFEKANNFRHLYRGVKGKVVLLLNDKQFDATLSNVNRKINSYTLKMSYGKDLNELLKTVFKSSFQYLKDSSKNDKKSIVVPGEIAEYIEFYKTREPFRYRMKIIRYGSKGIYLRKACL
jgi:5-methylcytosine-specific restriction enzyme B